MPLLLQSAVAWLALLVASVIVVETLLPLLLPRLHRAALEGRLPLVAAFAWLPFGLASALLAGSYAPWVMAELGLGHDHCGVHGGHVHLCIEHVHRVDLAGLGWALLLAAGGWLAWGGSEIAADLRRGEALLRSLRAVAETREDGVMVVDADVPWSVTAGLWAPHIIVTSALLDTFASRQRRAVLAHEGCHVDERHARVKLVAALGALVFRPSTRRALLAEVALACERRCDEKAAAAIGDRLDVAATLLATRRALASRLPLGILALHGSHLEARVRRLAEPAGSIPSSAAYLATFSAVLIGFAIVAGHELHHGIESMLSLLVR